MTFFTTRFLFTVFVSCVGTVLLLWNLLTPGYVLLLDWVPGPHPVLTTHTISSQIEFPTGFAIFSLSNHISPWVVQKGILVLLAFLLFFLPAYYYPFRLEKTYAHVVPYLASLIAMMNPFVYERLLAGQWRVLMGYALLFPLVYTLIAYLRAPSLRRALLVALLLATIGTVSTHFMLIGAIVAIIFGVAHIYSRISSSRRTHRERLPRRVLQGLGAPLHHALLALAVFFAASSYWLTPLLYESRLEPRLYTSGGVHNSTTPPAAISASYPSIASPSLVSTFTKDDFMAFETTRAPYIGAIGSVLTLRGFWAESHAWATQFRMPGMQSFGMNVLFYSAFFFLLLFVVVGIQALKYHDVEGDDTSSRRALIASVCFALFVSCGISAYGIWSINLWLLEHVPLWSGFRDTTKWNGVIALTYALFGSYGAVYVAETTAAYFKTHYRVSRARVVAVGAVCVVLCTMYATAPALLFGLGGQVSPVWYPQSWTDASVRMLEYTNEVSNEPASVDPVDPAYFDPDTSPSVSTVARAHTCKVLILPWHQYLSVSWNQNLLSAHPGMQAFPCDSITATHPEIGDVAPYAPHIPSYDTIHEVVTTNAFEVGTSAYTLRTLHDLGITHIAFARELETSDIYRYPFLSEPTLASRLQVVLDTPELVLYQL
jgi:hypothetical protein